MQKNGFAHPEVLVDTDWTELHLNDPKVSGSWRSMSTQKLMMKDISPVPSAGTGKRNCRIRPAATLSRKPSWKNSRKAGIDNTTSISCTATTITGSQHGRSGN